MKEKLDKVLKYLLVALEIEEKGRNFYEKAFNNSKNPLGRKIFKMLMDDELAHKKRIRIIYQALSKDNKWSDEWKEIKLNRSASEKIFRELKKKQAKNLKVDSGDMAGLEVGIGLELASITFYQERLTEALEEAEKEFLAQLVQEEKNHHNLLSDMKLYLKDPSSWFIEKERHGLDGV